MKKKDVKNQPIEEPIAAEQNACSEPQAEPQDDKVADSAAADADKVAESAAADAEQTDWRDKYIRLQAEFDNFRKRTLREKMELMESGGSKVLSAMLPVLDDMQRAITASERSEDINALREGERLVTQKFIDTLRQNKVVEIEALDAEFNPDLHEAVARFAAGKEKSGKVIDVVQKGYMLGDKVLRYAKVVVGE